MALGGYRAVTGRALLREIRGSFYRKLFLAFVAAAVVPVLALARADTRLRRERAARRHRDGRPAAPSSVAKRVVESVSSQQRRDSGGRSGVHRRGHGGRQPRDQRGRERLHRTTPGGDEPARPVRLRATARRARPSEVVPRDRARTAGQLRRRGTGRRASPTWSPPRRCATARRAHDRDGAACPPAAGDRARDRRARPACAAGHRVLHPARRRHRLLDGRAHRRSGEPPDARHAAHRARRPRRAHRRRLPPTSSGGSWTPSTGWPPTCSDSAASSNARTGSRRGPTWRGRWRTTSRTR